MYRSIGLSFLNLLPPSSRLSIGGRYPAHIYVSISLYSLDAALLGDSFRQDQQLQSGCNCYWSAVCLCGTSASGTGSYFSCFCRRAVSYLGTASRAFYMFSTLLIDIYWLPKIWKTPLRVLLHTRPYSCNL